MPARSVDEVFIENWTDLGTTTSVPRYSVDITIHWTLQNGSPGTYEDTVVFPNVLSGVPLQRLKRYMEDIILAEIRIQLGIDDE